MKIKDEGKMITIKAWDFGVGLRIRMKDQGLRVEDQGLRIEGEDQGFSSCVNILKYLQKRHRMFSYARLQNIKK